MKRIACLLFAFACLSLTACGQPQGDSSSTQKGVEWANTYMDLGEIAGKSQANVAKALGDPVTTSASTFAEGAVSTEYKNGTEILYVGDAAVRITIYPPEGSSIKDGAALIGLTQEEAGTASITASDDYRWSESTKYYRIDAFNNGDGTISYIYVITKEAYK